MEGVECACMGVCIWKGGVCVHGEREDAYMEGVQCACMGRGRVCAYGRVECIHGRGKMCAYGRVHGVCMHGGEGGCVHMEGFRCACMGRGRV